MIFFQIWSNVKRSSGGGQASSSSNGGGTDSNTSTLLSKDSGHSTLSNEINNPELRRSGNRDARPKTFAADSSRPEYMNLPENSKAAIAAASLKPDIVSSSSPAGNVSLDSGFSGHGGSMNRSGLREDSLSRSELDHGIILG